MAITTIDAVIRMRRGLEDDLDITKLQVGEWALSTDRKWVRICYAPSHVIKIASQEAMDETLEEIRGILNTIEGIEDIVEGYKNSAEGSATNASSSASAAESSATASANSATLSQSWAVGGTGTRSGENTDNAKYYAEQARQYTPEGYQDFVDDINHLKDVAADKALTPTSAVITNGVAEFETLDESRIKGLVVGIKPDQDLHGYTKPWVGGAGKNKLPSHAVGSTTVNGVTFTVAEDGTVTVNGTSTDDVGFVLGSLENLVVGTSYICSSGATGGSTSTYFINIAGAGSDANSFTFTHASNYTSCRIYIRNNVTLNNVVFKPMIRLASVTDASFEPYENICPIYGHDKCDIVDIGKNKFNPSNVLNAFFFSGYNITSEQSTRMIYAPCKPNTAYTVSKTAGQRFCVGYTKELPNIGVVVYDKTSDYTASSITITTGEDAKYIVAYVYHANYDTITADEMLASCQIELGSTATSYVPYRYQKVTISLGGTIYGGTLDVLKGVLTVDRKYKKGFTRGAIDTSGKLYKIDELSDAVNITTGSGVADLDESNMGIFLGLNPARASAEFCLSHYSTSFYVGGMVGKETELDALLPDLEIVYELATSIVIQLNPTVIKTLIGENNLSASTGDILSCIYTAMMNSDDVPTFEEKTALDGFTTVTGGLLSSCKVSLSPNQDLHGYEYPWVGGAGKNLLDTASFTRISGTSSGITVTVDKEHECYTMVGTPTNANVNVWFLGDYVPGRNVLTLPSGTYYVKGVNLYDLDGSGLAVTLL